MRSVGAAGLGLTAGASTATANENEERDDRGVAKSDTAETNDDTREIDPEAFKLLAADGDANDQFGYSVSVDDDTALVGTLFEDEQEVNAGAAYAFTRSGSTWSQQAKLLAPDGDARDWFGSSVSVNGDRVLVGAPNEDEQGTRADAAYAFDVSPVSDAGKPDDVGIGRGETGRGRRDRGEIGRRDR